MELCTQAGIAKVFGCSREAVRQLKNSHPHLFFWVGKKLDKIRTVTAISEAGKLKERVGVGSKKNQKQSTREQKEDINPYETGGLSNISKVELALKAEKYKTQKIKNDRDEKKLIAIEDITDIMFNTFRQLRDHQQSQKDRIGLKLEAAESAHEIEQILATDNHNGLNSIIENIETFTDEQLKKKLTELVLRSLPAQ